jgi:hypothetical protein
LLPILDSRKSVIETEAVQAQPAPISPNDWMRGLANSHACFQHRLFPVLEEITLNQRQAAELLRNYDAHASALRRLLLKAATLMPEQAVGFILENVRNEYGNGDPDKRHQLQLWDVALKAGTSEQDFAAIKIRPQIKSYIRQVDALYYPIRQSWSKPLLRPAIAGGAIAATELLAIREFQYLQKAFAKLGLQDHIWFDHVNIEVEHGDESLDLALYFISNHQATKEVEFGMQGVLTANLSLYDGLLACLEGPQ